MFCWLFNFLSKINNEDTFVCEKITLKALTYMYFDKQELVALPCMLHIFTLIQVKEWIYLFWISYHLSVYLNGLQVQIITII